MGARVNISGGLLKSFLSGFGPGVGDLRADAQQSTLRGGVGTPTHLLYRSEACDVEEKGEILFSDIDTVLSFLKVQPKESFVRLWQRPDRLQVSCGMSSIDVPSSNYIRSGLNIEDMNVLVEDGENTQWKSFKGKALKTYFSTTSKWLGEIAGMQKVVGKDMIYTTQYDSSEGQFIVEAGKKGGVRMSVATDLHTHDGEDSSSVFGQWLPELMATVPTGAVDVFTSDGFIMVLRHVDKDFLLIALDQDGE
jgi:hypothetical protein